MKAMMRRSSILMLMLLIAALAMSPLHAAGLTTVHYPTQANAQFTVTVPSDWTLIPQGEEGAEDYFEVEGPKGLELSFRVVPGADIDQAVKDHVAYLEENFSEITMGDSRETQINGMDAILLPAKGKDEDGVAREFGAGWFKLADGAIGELWYNVDASDAAGTKAAIDVLNSLKKP